jgi:hypothetical protein
MNLGRGRDPEIRDPEKNHPGSESRILGIKNAPDPGSEIRDPEKKSSRIRIPGPWDKNAPDPGSGSATLHFIVSKRQYHEMFRLQFCKQ